MQTFETLNMVFHGLPNNLGEAPFLLKTTDIISEETNNPACSLHELRTIHLLDGIDDIRLEKLRKHLCRCQYARGEVILRQGEMTEALYFLLSGKVAVILKDGDGKQHTLADLDSGDTFGERALLTGELRTAAVIASTSVQARQLSLRELHLLEVVSGKLPMIYIIDKIQHKRLLPLIKNLVKTLRLSVKFCLTNRAI